MRTAPIRLIHPPAPQIRDGYMNNDHKRVEIAVNALFRTAMSQKKDPDTATHFAYITSSTPRAKQVVWPHLRARAQKLMDMNPRYELRLDTMQLRVYLRNGARIGVYASNADSLKIKGINFTHVYVEDNDRV